jgi:hypothetical protein
VNGDESAGRSVDNAVPSGDIGGWGGVSESAGRSNGGGCRNVPVSVTGSGDGCGYCGDVSSVPISRSDGAVCEGAGSGISSAYGSASSWAGSLERAGVFCDDGASNDVGLAAG